MSPILRFVSCMLLLAIVISVSRPTFGAGISSLVDAIFLVSSKQACDSAVPGFRERTEGLYRKWEVQNAEWIKMMGKTNYNGMEYPVFIEKLKEEFITEFKGELQTTCNEIVDRLEKSSAVQKTRKTPGQRPISSNIPN